MPISGFADISSSMEKIDHLFIQPLDFNRSLLFFTETLGWKVVKNFGESSDASRLVYMNYGDFTVVMAEDHDTSDPTKKPKIYNTKGRLSIHFNSSDIDATFKKIKDGSHVVVRPENNHWGTRWFMVEDPDGNQFGWQGPVKPL